MTDKPGAPWEKRPALQEETFSPLLPQPPGEDNTDDVHSKQLIHLSSQFSSDFSNNSKNRSEKEFDTSNDNSLEAHENLKSKSFQHDWKKAASSLNADASASENAPEKKNTRAARLEFADLLNLLQYYFGELKSVCLQPNHFFREQGANESITDALVFVSFTCVIPAFLLLVSQDFSFAISIVIGTAIFVATAAFAVRYIGQWLANVDLDLEMVGKVIGYSQAPFVVAWLKLGNAPIGWLLAAVYSVYLMCVGLEEVFPIDRQQAIIITISLSLLIRGILHLIGL